ncbi:uncharacterized protein K441DRAFT_591310, partial [Cenococcum geophilum 1.58]
ILLLLLLSVAISIRLGALVERASNRGSNRALYFKDIKLISIIIVNINLENIKNKNKDKL